MTVQICSQRKNKPDLSGKMSLKEYYKRNLDLVTEEGDDVEIVQKQEKEGLLGFWRIGITSGCLRQLIRREFYLPANAAAPDTSCHFVLAGIGAVCYPAPGKKRMRDISLASFRCCAIRVWIDTASGNAVHKTGFTGRTAHGNIGSYQWNPDTKRTKI